LQELAVENGRLQERMGHLEAGPERSRVEAARRETEETARLADEAAGVREAAEGGARRPWWRCWG
jgi:hypothetical protein